MSRQDGLNVGWETVHCATPDISEAFCCDGKNDMHHILPSPTGTAMTHIYNGLIARGSFFF